ncbi:MAG: hypothetical protein RBJ76_03200 [Stenomitos frigidus ULC029]
MRDLTLLQITNPELSEEYLEAVTFAPEVGDLVALGEDSQKRFEVVALYRYVPIALNAQYRVSLAIVHPINQPVPEQSDWYAWENAEYCSKQVLHVLLHDENVLRTEERSAGQLPAVDSVVINSNYRSKGTQEVKLDSASIRLAMGKASAMPTGLEIASYETYVSLDAPYKAIYTVETQRVEAEIKLLQSA